MISRHGYYPEELWDDKPIVFKQWVFKQWQRGEPGPGSSGSGNYALGKIRRVQKCCASRALHLVGLSGNCGPPQLGHVLPRVSSLQPEYPRTLPVLIVHIQSCQKDVACVIIVTFNQIRSEA